MNNFEKRIVFSKTECISWVEKVLFREMRNTSFDVHCREMKDFRDVIGDSFENFMINSRYVIISENVFQVRK